MKKLFTFVVLAAMLLVSCVKEQKFADEMGDQTSVHFTVAAGLATKAESNFATGTGVDALAVQAFIKDGDGNFQKTNATVTIAEVPGSSPKEWDVDMKLAKNREYKLAFFAYKSAAAVYDVTNLSAVAVDYEKIAANSDDADAFCAGRYIQVSGAISETVVLYRPLAQINVGTNDLDEYKNSTLESMQDITIQVTADAVPNTLNVIGANPDDDGVVAATVSGEQTVAFERVDILDVEDELIEGYDYLSMAYVLADKEKETMTFTIDMDFGDEATAHDATSAEHICKIEVTNLPYQANYKTNIFGQLLTGNLHYDVEISPEFETPDFDKEIAPGFESVAELNAYFAKFETNADNGNVDPEEVILNGVSDGDVISLPKTAENLVIRVNAVCDGTVTIQYAEGAEEATQKPENIYLYFKNLGTLVLKTPDSHVELLSGSVLGAATVYTNGDTFVIQQGAKVGELEVKEGNADVAGEATTVTVKAANADEKIEVTVQKTAQVETINLQTPADVIVEQPKDNIDKDATDNKVCVNVAATAAGSTATAQNGGDIYVNAIADCAVASEGEESSAYVSIADGVEVDTDGEVEVGFIYVAQMGEEKYTSLQKAFDAVQPGTPAEIVVLQDIVSSAGVFLAKGEKEINLDLAGHIVSFFGPAVGSTGTATQGFHLEKGNIVKISNGKVALDEGHPELLQPDSDRCRCRRHQPPRQRWIVCDVQQLRRSSD